MSIEHLLTMIACRPSESSNLKAHRVEWDKEKTILRGYTSGQ